MLQFVDMVRSLRLETLAIGKIADIAILSIFYKARPATRLLVRDLFRV